MPKNRRNRSRNRGGTGNDRAKMRMDDVRSGPGRRENENRSARGRRACKLNIWAVKLNAMLNHTSANSPRRRELGDAMERARKDGGQSSFWTKKLLEAEARVPDRYLIIIYVNKTWNVCSSVDGGIVVLEKCIEMSYEKPAAQKVQAPVVAARVADHPSRGLNLQLFDDQEPLSKMSRTNPRNLDQGM